MHGSEIESIELLVRLYRMENDQHRATMNDTASDEPKKILIVDDEEALVRLVSIKLKLSGYEVTGAEDPREALDLFKAWPQYWDLVITDMVMPGMSGMDLAKEILDVRPDLPIILCSGYSSLSVQDALASGIFKYMQKPLDFNELVDVVQEAIGKEA
jgi:DNA-binding NtrC family response regulator